MKIKKIKHLKLIILISTIIIIYCIYNFASGSNLIYIALGDSFALGENPYGEIAYGYSDYLATYLNQNQNLKFYTKNFATKNARIKDVYQDIQVNKTIYVNDYTLGIKNALREADYITLSIGASDILYQVELLGSLFSQDKQTQILKNIQTDLQKLLREIKKYNKNITLIGYYNLYPNKDIYQSVFANLDTLYKKISRQEKINYISLYDDFPYQKYLPNPFNIHPSVEGYEYIYKKIIENIMIKA